jgi:hypothetical protein
MRRPVLVPLLVGCALLIGGGATSGTAATPATASTSNVIRRYVDGLGSQRAVASSQPGSPASGLARHDLAVAQAFAANHRRQDPQQAQFSNGAALVCPKGAKAGPRCTTLTDFQNDPATGRVITFAVNTVPLDRRIAGGSGQPVAITGPAGMIGIIGLYSAYQTGSSQLVVVADFAGDIPPGTNPSRAVLIVQEDGIRYLAPGVQPAKPDSLLNQNGPHIPSFKVTSTRNVLRIVLFFQSQALGGQLLVSTVGRPPSPNLVGNGQLPVG